MTNKVKRGLLGRVLRWIVPLLISGVAIWLVLRDIEFFQFMGNLSRIGWGVILLGFLLHFVSYLFRVICWYILLRKKVSFKNTFFTMGAGYLLNNVFPFRLGEIGRAVLLDDPEGPSALEVLSSVLVERIFDVFLAAVFLLSMLPRILGAEYDQTLIVIAFALTLIGLLILYLAAKFRENIKTWLANWGQKANFIKHWILPKATQVLEGLSVLNNIGAFIAAFTSLAVSWFLAFGLNYVIFRSLFANPPFWWMIFVLSAGAFGAALPSAPAGLGVFEGVMVAAFALLGVNAELAFTHAIVIHAISFIFNNIIGLIGLRLRGEVLIGLYQRVIKRSPKVKAVE